jgi:raffinose/stachyose/melibiose transport system permease protein
MLPLSRPVLSTIAVLTIVGSWNAFLLPLLVLTAPEQWTLPLGINNISAQYVTDTAAILAYTTAAMIPALTFYFIAQRQIVSGLTAGGVKG